MQYEIFTVPVYHPEESIEVLNRFLRGHKVLQVDKQLVPDGTSSFWTFCVSYLNTSNPTGYKGEKREKVDYKEVLAPDQFELFSRLRMCRKEIAAADAVPAYAVFTDAELAEFSKSGHLDEKSVLAVDGIGKSRLDKYGLKLLKMLNESQSPDA